MPQFSIRSSFPFVALWAVPLALGAAGCTLEPATGTQTDEPTTENAAAVTCVTLRRTAVGGAVEDATLAMDPMDPSRANQPNGGSISLGVGSAGTILREVLIRFDLSPIPANVPVTSATLNLYKGLSLGSGTAELHRATAPWTEATATWSSFAQSFDPAVLGLIYPSTIPTNGLASVDLTSLTQAWNQGSLANDGVALLEPTNGRAVFGASEGPAALRPQLVVCYVPPTCGDGLQNQGEGGVDCGGPCAACFDPCAGVVCAQPDACHSAGVCDPLTGQCSNPVLADGTGCEDGNLCTPTDTCQSGVCVGGAQAACVSVDGCHQGTCDPATGLCDSGAITSLGCGSYHTCAVKATGAATCWGTNPTGQSAPSGAVFSQMTSGNGFSCGLQLDGTVACWGYNGYGESTPPSGSFDQIASGQFHTCGIQSSGAITCWGSNVFGESVPPAGTFSVVRSRANHTCAVRTDGTLACWGYNSYGQANAEPGTFTSVSTGFYHTCGLQTDGTVTCWGNNTWGQTAAPSGQFSDLAGGYLHTCGLRTDGTAECWGHNFYGAASPPPGPFTALGAGESYSCGLRPSGAVECWGSNLHGQTTLPPLGPALPDGSACDDGDGCAQADACQSGSCIGGDPLLCAAPTN